MADNVVPQATSPLATWLTYLENLHTSAIDLGLDRVQAVAERASLTKPSPFVITVAGTNGKGSTCALLESILLTAGYSVGVYSSPHLIRYAERVRINGEELPEAEHSEAFAEIEFQRGETSLSFFEFGTLAALALFKKHQPDVVLLEVGLGGRLDATNVVDHDISVITSLAVDHVDWLGDDINVIGFEKAGIFRANKPAICGQPLPPATVAAHADDIGANLYQVGYQFEYQQQGDVWHWRSGAFDLNNLPVPDLPLANAATSIMVLGVSPFDISDQHIVEGLKNAQLAGRMQVIAQSPYTVLDVAHNPHSANYLASSLKRKQGKGKVHAVVAMLHDKDIEATLAEMTDVVDYWYAASLEGPRAASAEELLSHLPQQASSHPSPVLAYHAAVSAANENDIVLVFGSFYTVGQIIDELG
ncbi:bifunctional tetrahydrofolate synthase/dihydrofolate synthase [Thaumasiovibrio subtropicus]|uniref:bifunctional tetrahydrofolate synthase/dihydrofolate synthase n=1 Tax=Thaumasiovibrio subtropicus TaxID=1891207 RepID=UPI000B359CD7|nr:bifunctional tetrahydrofolate synthase/dihydrofolate synthase [Thaumasiovibrio subtropicus]